MYGTFGSAKAVPAAQPSLLARLLFLPVRPLVALAATRELSLDVLWPLAPSNRSANAAPKFRSAFASTGSLEGAVWRTERQAVMQSGLLSFVVVAATSVLPFMLFRLLTAVMNPSEGDTTRIVLLLAGMYATLVVGVIVFEQARLVLANARLRVMAAIRSLLYELALEQPVTRAHGMQTATAALATIYSSNLVSIDMAISKLHHVWMSTTQLAVLLVVLRHLLHVSTLMIGASLSIVCLVLLLISLASASRSQSCTKKRAKTLASVNECFKSIQAVKLQAWESKAHSKIMHARAKEERKQWSLLVLRSVMFCIIWESPALVSVAIYTGIASHGGYFSPATVFTALVLFDRIQSEVYTLTHAIRTLIEGRKSLRKLGKYIRDHEASVKQTVSRTAPIGVYGPRVVISIERAFFSEGQDHLNVVLFNVNLKVLAGELVVIHGPAGAGKSMLLTSLIGEANRPRGSVYVSDQYKIAYCSQDPWLQTLSIRDNILFGTEFEEVRYWRVLDACCLHDDLATLANGDETVVGPKGINLSGGQKARVALARALYSEADLYLLDTPLATSDAIVQSDIFRKCFLELLRHKTVVITTHNPEVISSEFVDRLWHVNEMQVLETVRDKSTSASKAAEGSSRRIRRLTSAPPWRMRRQESQVAGEPTDASFSFAARFPVDQTPIRSIRRSLLIENAQPKQTSEQVRAHVLSSLWKLPIVYRAVPVVVLLLLFYGGLQVARNFWLVHWSHQRPKWSLMVHSAVVYGGMIVGAFAVLLLATFLVFYIISRCASAMFSDTTKSLLCAPMTTFYHTKIGDILSRYSNNIQMADVFMAYPTVMLLRADAVLISSLGTICYLLGVFGVLIALVVAYIFRIVVDDRLFAQMQALRASLDAHSMSFVSESLDGGPTIRAFGSLQLSRFYQQNQQMIDGRSRTVGTLHAFESWMLVRWSLITAVIFGLLAMVLIRGNLDSSSVGLVLYCIFTVQERDLVSLSFGVLKVSVHLEAMGSLFEFQQLASEQDSVPQQALIGVSTQWPTVGEIVFDRVWFQYETRETVDGVRKYSLEDVSFRVRAGERIGVIGRTGSGKSSLAMALFRIHELQRGRILIDGVDISRLQLKDLRSRLCLIPQSPLFYRCSVRSYLDPFHEFEDTALWRVLHRTGLAVDADSTNCITQGRVVVRDLGKKLSENGDNWSMGERQMLALARTLLKPSAILVLDEAFSSLDQECDKQLLAVVDEEFARSTVFLMTHRLDQVLNFDQIMVMQAGRVVEMGRAEELVTNPDSAFYEFLETTLLTF